MDDRLRDAVARLRAGLDRRTDSGDSAGVLPPGSMVLPPGVDREVDLSGVSGPYADFLRITNGGAYGYLGEIRLTPADGADRLQFTAEQYEWLQLPGGVARWFVFGDIQQNPLLLDRETGQVWWFSDLTIVWYTDVPPLRSFARLADTFTEFFLDVIAGPGYSRILGPFPTGMEAWQTLIESGL